LVLKVCGEFDNVTSAGKLFHVADSGQSRRLDIQCRGRR